MKIGIIGCGYWGKIIINNLLQMGYNDLILCDEKKVSLNLGSKFKVRKDYRKIKCDKVFVLTPATKHFEICKYFLEKGVDVFCEKPLTDSPYACTILYNIAKKNNTKLFVDWIFTYNSQVNTIKKIYNSGILGEIKHVNMSRQNFGPKRFDVDAKMDLATHDISILFYLFNKQLEEIHWIDYNRDPNDKQNDSALGFLTFSNFKAIINVSWHHSKKDRMCFFDFENGYIEWDDTRKSLNLSLIHI